MLGTAICAVIYCIFLLSRSDLNEIIKNIPYFLSDTEHEGNNVLGSIILWFARIAFRYRYMLPGMGFAVVYIFFRIKKKKRLNWKTDIIYAVINLIICFANVEFSGDMMGCANIAISIFAANLYFLIFFLPKHVSMARHYIYLYRRNGFFNDFSLCV